MSHTSRRPLLALVVVVLLAGVTAVAARPTASAQGDAPPVWTDADKDGIAAAVGAASPLLVTLDDGRVTEAYYPRLDTPSIRSLDLVVTDGRTFTHVASEDLDATIDLVDERALVYRQTASDPDGRYRLHQTVVTDPDRPVVLVDVALETLDGGPYRVFAHLDPQLANTGRDDTAATRGRALVADDGEAAVASALVARPALGARTNGLDGTGGLAALRADHDLGRRVDEAGPGDVVQTARLRLRGDGDLRHATLAIGLGDDERAALRGARTSLLAGFDTVAEAYADGWHGWLDSLSPRPDAVADWPVHYDVSLMVLKATEDARHPGAAVASPSMPWAWADLSIHDPSGPYHLVWPRDLYHTATALLAAGDRDGAEHMLDFLFRDQQEDDGSFPQNSRVDGEPFWTSEQLDETALPIVLAWQLGRDDPGFVRDHIEPAANFLLDLGPYTEQERWEEEEGFSPYAIATGIAGLVTAADLAARAGDVALADLYLATADRWADQVDDWTFTTTGPLGDGAYYLRINADLDPDDGDPRELGNGAGTFDERRIVDPSFLELVRLGIKAPDDPTILASLPELDADLMVETPNGPVWHRYSFDGYGETDDGAPWALDQDGTTGRLWPILSGERGEYALAAGDVDTAREMLATLARTATPGYLMPEQVWDLPEGGPFAFGEATRSATPLGWTHGQFVRLAWSIEHGAPVETPAVVACRYLGERCSDVGE